MGDTAVFQVHTERAGGPADLVAELKRPGRLENHSMVSCQNMVAFNPHYNRFD